MPQPDQPPPRSAAPVAFEDFLIYEGNELIFDGRDPSTYVVCETAEDIEKAFASMSADAQNAA